MKKIVSVLFCVLMLNLGIMLVACGENEKQKSVEVPANETNNTTKASTEEIKGINSKVIAYYFHGNFRCANCTKIEAYSKEAVETGFKQQIQDGVIEWKVVNTDEPANKHFMSDYQLFTKSLVIVKLEDGKQVEWKNLQKVWEYLNNKDKFIKYVQDEVNAYLESK